MSISTRLRWVSFLSALWSVPRSRRAARFESFSDIAINLEEIQNLSNQLHSADASTTEIIQKGSDTRRWKKTRVGGRPEQHWGIPTSDMAHIVKSIEMESQTSNLSQKLQGCEKNPQISPRLLPDILDTECFPSSGYSGFYPRCFQFFTVISSQFFNFFKSSLR